MTPHWRAPDGAEFPILRWVASPARASIVCLHGLSGAAGDFTPFGETLSQVGYTCCALNLRGQGMDPDLKRRGHFLDPDALADDIAAHTWEVAQDGLPVFLCGESLGALLLAHTIAKRSLPPLAGAIFSSPVVALRHATPEVARWLLRLAAQVIPGLRLPPGLFVRGRAMTVPISRDQDWVVSHRTGPHHISAFSVNALYSIGLLMESMPGIAARISVPSLVLSAGKDVFVAREQVGRWFDQISAPDKHLIHYPESHHVLWNDWDREQVLSDIQKWLDSRISERSGNPCQSRNEKHPSYSRQ